MPDKHDSDTNDFFLRVCPRCLKMWRGPKEKRDWNMETIPTTFEHREVINWDAALQKNVTYRIRVWTVKHAECGGEMYDGGVVVATFLGDR